MNPEEAQTLIASAGQLDRTFLGTRKTAMGVEENIAVEDDKRRLHTMVTGPTGSGKTNFLQTVFLQDIRKGGAAFLNPKGEAIDQIIAKLPEDRLNDVEYINPGKERCPAINLLSPEAGDQTGETGRERHRKIVVSNVMALFRRLSDDVGERWPRNLRSLLNAHVSLNLANGEQNTLMDVYETVEDDEKLVDLMNRVTDQVTKKQLEEVKELSDREKQPLLRRLSDLLENKVVRRIITQPESTISFREAMAEEKIILIDAQGGNVGDWAARILGSVVLTQLWSATATRQNQAKEDRPYFAIHVDEVQEFISEADHLKRMLSQCREYNVSITLATQMLDDIDNSLEKAMLNNANTKVVFAPSASNSLPTYSRIMNGLSKSELSQLGQYRPAVQRPAEEEMPQAVTIQTYPPWEIDEQVLENRKEDLVEKNPALTETTPDTSTSTGDTAASGGETHEQLLKQAKQYLEFEQDVHVNIQHQDGEKRPDALIIADNEINHLEAENSTLSKPDKVLTNLQRAVKQDRQCYYIVNEERLDRLKSILKDVDQDHYQILVNTDLGVTKP
jgi:energy-coupling factor transporter ATP-binding protein EcfA2